TTLAWVVRMAQDATGSPPLSQRSHSPAKANGRPSSRRKASRKEGFSATVSDRALRSRLPMSGSFAQCGIRPQRARTNSRPAPGARTTATGQEALALRGHTDVVNAVAFSQDGRRLASASQDLAVRVWEAATGQETLTLKGHAGTVYGVCFSPDGHRLASASGDGTVKVWGATPVSEPPPEK